MKDDKAQIHFAAVRAKLNKHCYHQHMSNDSVLLAETMINDLIASAASFTDLQKKDSEKTKELQLLITELDGLRVENPRLKAENNVLHLEIMEAVESTETWEASVRSKLQSLEDEIESTKMNLQQESRTNFQKEQELHHLQAEATALSLLEVESKVAAFVARSKDLEEQGNKLCTQLFEGSKPSQPLRLRAVKAQLEAESSRKRRGVEEQHHQIYRGAGAKPKRAGKALTLP
eukprot:g6816.t1